MPGPQESLRHDTGMVVVDLPLSILPDVDERVSSLDLVSGGTHGELVNSGVLAPVVSNSHVALKNLALRLLLKEADEVVLNERVVRPGNVRHSGEKNSLLAVSPGDRVGILRGQGRVPQLEEVLEEVRNVAGRLDVADPLRGYLNVVGVAVQPVWTRELSSGGGSRYPADPRGTN